ncbi:MAG: phenylalanine--tRNA ligase subunit beta, partial [Planctomycetota bacterium]
WMNRYLEPGNVTPDEAVRVLEATSFPIEERQDLPDGDAVLDVEITSNRGDCVCHLGLARELSAATGRRLVVPEVTLGDGGGAVSEHTSIDNQVPGLCPRFTARIIRGVTVGPSPAWLVDLLERIGQRSINNIVDVSNFVLFELGHPSHTFDLNTLAEQRLIVRHATDGEAFTALDGKSHTLRTSDLVVADAKRAVSLAGVIGGLDTGVTEKTTDVLLEVATWDPPTIRRTARRLDIRTDAGYRFERIVDPRNLAWASARVAELILEVAGGELVDGLISEGRSFEPRSVVDVRLARVAHVLGIDIPAAEITGLLRAVGFDVAGDGTLACTVPHDRPDVTREIDVIEEIARLHGIDKFPVASRLDVPLEIDHPTTWADREHVLRMTGDVLTAHGFYETVTFSFLPEAQAVPFVQGGERLVKVDEARRKDAPFLRPSIVPSLLTCRRANQDGRVEVDGGVRLFEIASTFAEEDAKEARKTIERQSLAMVMDAGTKHQQQQASFRAMRGAIEDLIERIGGHAATVRIETASPNVPILVQSPAAKVVANGSAVGRIALLGTRELGAWGLDGPVVCAELDFAELLSLYPPENKVASLPTFPAIERDLSLVVDESLPWADLHGLVEGLDLELLEHCSFVGTFRGTQVGAGRKSVTLRLGFRDPGRTLRHEEVDPQMERLVGAATSSLGAEVRS